MPWLKDIRNEWEREMFAEIRIPTVQITTDGDFYPLEERKSTIGIQHRLKD